MLTIVTQIECALNDSPLTGTSEDVNELQPLTPSMLLNGSRINNLPICFDVEEFYDPSFNCKEMVSKRFKYCTKLLHDFLVRWKHEYLLALRERDKNLMCAKSPVPLLDRLVLVHDDQKNRLLWPMGIICKLHISADGHVRSVDVKTKNSILTRPIAKLYPLELDVATSQSEVLEKNEISEVQRSSRKAALAAREKIKACLLD